MAKHKNRTTTASQGQLLAERTRCNRVVNRRGQSTLAHREYIGDAC